MIIIERQADGRFAIVRDGAVLKTYPNAAMAEARLAAGTYTTVCPGCKGRGNLSPGMKCVCCYGRGFIDREI